MADLTASRTESTAAQVAEVHRRVLGGRVVLQFDELAAAATAGTVTLVLTLTATAAFTLWLLG